jgi:hypothetical protein
VYEEAWFITRSMNDVHTYSPSGTPLLNDVRVIGRECDGGFAFDLETTSDPRSPLTRPDKNAGARIVSYVPVERPWRGPPAVLPQQCHAVRPTTATSAPCRDVNSARVS